MAVLVIGGKGFIGAAIVHQLVARGEEVVCLDLKGTPGRLGDVSDRITLLDGGLTTVESLVDILRKYNVDKIVNSVFFMSEKGNAEQIYKEFSVMIAGTAVVFEAARIAGVRRVVSLSSIHYFGPQWKHGDGLLTEESPSCTDDLYGVGKNMCETLAKAYNIRAGMEIYMLRVPGVYGRGAKVGARGVNLAAVEAALGKPATFFYSPDQKVVLGHVDDVAAAIVTVLSAGSPKHMVYNIGGHSVTLFEVASIIKEFIPGAHITFKEELAWDLPDTMDYTRIRGEFGFEHRDLKQGYLDLMNMTRREAGLAEIALHQH